MFERCAQTANHFRSRFEERLGFRLGHLTYVAAQMIDQFPELFPEHSRYAPADLLMQSFPYNAFACGTGTDGSESVSRKMIRASVKYTKRAPI